MRFGSPPDVHGVVAVIVVSSLLRLLKSFVTFLYDFFKTRLEFLGFRFDIPDSESRLHSFVRSFHRRREDIYIYVEEKEEEIFENAKTRWEEGRENLTRS